LRIGRRAENRLSLAGDDHDAPGAIQVYRQLLETLDQLSWINLELLRRNEPLSGESSPV
jgi:hypothetical protein